MQRTSTPSSENSLVLSDLHVPMIYLYRLAGKQVEFYSSQLYESRSNSAPCFVFCLMNSFLLSVLSYLLVAKKYDVHIQFKKDTTRPIFYKIL